MCFRNSLLKNGRQVQNSIFKVFNPLEIKFLLRLRLVLSHLNEHRFKHIFQKCLKCFYVPVVWKLNQLFTFS